MSNESRDLSILAMIADGRSITEVATAFDLSPQRISQIIQEQSGGKYIPEVRGYRLPRPPVYNREAITTYLQQHPEASPREVADHLSVPVDRVRAIGRAIGIDWETRRRAAYRAAKEQ